MSVPAGHKATEVGVIPEDWEAKPLSSLKPFITSGSRGWAKYYAEAGDAFVRITNLSRQNIYPDLSDLRRVRLPEGENEGTRTGLRNGDVLVSITADIGIIGFVDDRVPKPAYINQHIAIVRVDQSEANSKFLSYFLATEGSQRRVRATTDAGAKAGMSLTGVGNLLAAFPPTVTEQSAIAEALSDVDEAIAAQESVIAKKRALKTATMQAILSGTRRLPGFGVPAQLNQFKHTEVGVIPNDWEIARLGDLLSRKPSYGINAPAVPYDDRLPRYLRITDITEDGRFRKSSAVSVKHSSSEQYYLDPGDLVFARTGASTGKSYRYREADGRLVYAGFLIRVSPNSVRLVSKYLAAQVLTRNFEKYVAEVSQRSGQPGINGKQLADFQLPVPPTIDEQKAIAETLIDMEEDVEVNETRLAKLRHVKAGMMQQLLTGKIRLV